MNTIAIKFLSLTMVILCMGYSLQAQTAAGTFSVGGAISAGGNKTHYNDAENKSTSFYFSPTVGYFVADNLMVGASLNTSVTRSDWNNPTTSTSTKQTFFSLGPYMRYYKFTSNEQFAFYGEFSLSFGLGRTEINGGDPTKSSTFETHISPGFAWFPTPHWGVDLSMSLFSFSSTKPDKDDDGGNNNSFGFGFNTFTPSLGIRYYF